MISIVDYGAGNLQSVRNAFFRLGADTIVASTPDQLEDAQALILPGVGAFGDAMEALCSRGFPDAIRAFLESGRPFLGICLGMQLLLDSSEESPGVEGLHILKGTVRRFPSDMGLKVPHIGFNSIVRKKRCRPVRWSRRMAVLLFCSFLLLQPGRSQSVRRPGRIRPGLRRRRKVAQCICHPVSSGEKRCSRPSNPSKFSGYSGKSVTNTASVSCGTAFP